MREPFGYKQTLLIGSRQNFAVPVQKSGRALSDIYGDIVNLTAKATDDLAFGIRRILEMQTADGPLYYGKGVVNLGNGFFQPGCLEFFGAKESAEKAPRILEGLPLHNTKSFKRRRTEVETVILFYFQIFHLAWPSLHILLRYSMSRRVSMQAQNPRCLYTISCFSLAIFSKGPISRSHKSSVVR